MKPLPWSHSRLEDFKNCPRAFYEKQVAKSVVEAKGEATIWGERVHKHFEDRLVDKVPLPTELVVHEPFLARLESMAGTMSVEERIALDTGCQPCEFFGDEVWFRGVIDVKIVNKERALLIDHKTGKHHNKFGQLKLFAIHTFLAHPDVAQVDCKYYWTQTFNTTGMAFRREQLEELWGGFVPDLVQYATAFRQDVWQPRQSGLCRGWCPVTSCEFWQPKRMRS